MNLKEIVEIMDEISALSKRREDQNDEIRYWREKYLSSLPKYENKYKAAYIWNMFLGLPSSEFMKIRTCEKLIKVFEQQYDMIEGNEK